MNHTILQNTQVLEYIRKLRLRLVRIEENLRGEMAKKIIRNTQISGKL